MRGKDTVDGASVIVSPVLVVRDAPAWIAAKISLATTGPWVAATAACHEARSVPVVWWCAISAAPASRLAAASPVIAACE